MRRIQCCIGVAAVLATAAGWTAPSQSLGAAAALELGPPALMSYSTDGFQTDRGAAGGWVINDDRTVAFVSEATDFDGSDAAGLWERDIATGTTTRVSTDEQGKPIDVTSADGEYRFVSNDGRYIAFGMAAPAPTPAACLGDADVPVLKDVATGNLQQLDNGEGDCQSYFRIDGLQVSANGEDVLWAGRTASRSDSIQGLWEFDRTTGAVTDLQTLLPSDAGCNFPQMSPDGSTVACQVTDSAGTTETMVLIDVRDGTSSVLTAPNGKPITSVFASLQPFSSDGNLFTFESSMSGIVPRDTNGNSDTFVYDQASGSFERESLTSGGAQAFGNAGGISPDGRYVTFQSSDPALSATGGAAGDVYVRDRTSGVVRALNCGADCAGATISGDDGVLAFTSSSPLVDGDLNTDSDVFIVSLNGGTTAAPSATPADGQITATWSSSASSATPAEAQQATLPATSSAAAASAHVVLAHTIEVRERRGAIAPAGLKQGRLVYEGSHRSVTVKRLKDAQDYSFAIFRFATTGTIASRQVLTARPQVAPASAVRIKSPRAVRRKHRFSISARLTSAANPTRVAHQALVLYKRVGKAHRWHRVARRHTTRTGRSTFHERVTAKAVFKVTFAATPFLRGTSRRVTVRLQRR